MDDVMQRLARELAEAIGVAVSEDPRVKACREKGRSAGYEMRVSLEAEIGFGNRRGLKPETDVTTRSSHKSRQLENKITANDRRFLRSLRITAEELKQ